LFGKIARGLVRGPSVRENEGKEEVCAWAWAEFLWADVHHFDLLFRASASASAK
jgi:hypothetical protein